MGTVGAVGLAVSGVQLVVMLGSILVVERALKKTFDKNGKKIKKDKNPKCNVYNHKNKLPI